MRFRKGDRVEVMNQNEIPVSWVVGQILSSNDSTCHVKYDFYPRMCNNKMVETVSKMFIRPCPPLLQDVERFIPGDIVEVFHEYSWKLASMLKIPQKNKEIRRRKNHSENETVQNHYVVRLLGCLKEVLIHKSIVRMRQVWHDGKWIPIGRKSSLVDETVLASKTSISNHYRNSSFQVAPSNAPVDLKHQQEQTYFPGDASLQESLMISSRSLKRKSPYSSSFVEARDGGVRKSRAVENRGRIYKVTSTTPLHDVDCPKDELGNKNRLDLHNNISNGYNQMDNAKRSGILCSSAADFSDNDECSVGSCSGNGENSTNNRYNSFAKVPCDDREVFSSDAESCDGSGFGRNISCLRSDNEGVEVSLRRLELHAYRSTLEALYASGPLSWEQEAMLTDLRMMLRISNDEHSMELKHLTKSAVNVR